MTTLRTTQPTSRRSIGAPPAAMPALLARLTAMLLAALLCMGGGAGAGAPNRADTPFAEAGPDKATLAAPERGAKRPEPSGTGGPDHAGIPTTDASVPQAPRRSGASAPGRDRAPVGTPVAWKDARAPPVRAG